MLTPLELEKNEFKKGIGYSKKSVNEFYEKLRADYEAIYKENIELKDKISKEATSFEQMPGISPYKSQTDT